MADVIPPAQDLPFTLQPIGKVMIVEFRNPSLMDPVILENTSKRLYKLVDEEDNRNVVLDFEKVQYLSSQAIGILLSMKKKIDALGHGKLVLCGIGPKLAELLKITRLDKVMIIKSTQKEALATFS
jgi:anti-sigma B factor antagonist